MSETASTEISNAIDNLRAAVSYANCPREEGYNPWDVIEEWEIWIAAEALLKQNADLERQLAEAEIYRIELDEQLILHHIGTVEDFDSPKQAHVALQKWCYDHGKYDAQHKTVTDEQIEKLFDAYADRHGAWTDKEKLAFYAGYRAALEAGNE